MKNKAKEINGKKIEGIMRDKSTGRDAKSGINKEGVQRKLIG